LDGEFLAFGGYGSPEIGRIQVSKHGLIKGTKNMDDKVYDQREDLYEAQMKRLVNIPPNDSEQEWQKRANRIRRENALASFLEALDEWGCVDHYDMAREIIKFEDSGMDLSDYRAKD
jgi:hypothetical protein